MGDRFRWSNPRNNPCLAEADRSYKCLDENNYNRDKCTKYFQEYKECKSRMNKERREANRKKSQT